MKVVSRRAFLRSAGLALAGVVVAACGPTPTPTPVPVPTKAAAPAAPQPATAPTPAAKAPIELRIGWWGNVTRNKLYDGICDLYQQKNPNITLVRENAGWSDYWTKVATQAAGKNLPDITASVIDTLAEYAQRGAYLSMDPFIEKKTIDTTYWPKPVMDAFKVDGKVYMMPTGITINIVMVNEDMIKRAGVEPPAWETSYDEFATYARALQKKLDKDVYAISDPAISQEHFQGWILQKGYQIANEKATDVGFPKEVVIEFHKYWMDLYKAGCVLPIELYSQPQADMWADDWFTKQRCTMRFTNSNQLKGWQQYQKDNIVIIRNLVMPNGKQRYGEYMRPSALSLASNSKYPEEAAKFINFFVNDLEACKIFNMELGAVGPTNIAQELMKTVHPKDVLVLKHFEDYTTKNPPYKMIDPKGTSAVLQAARRASDAIRYGTAIETAVDTFMKEAKEAYAVNVT